MKLRPGDPVFVDTGAWIALASTGDSLHGRAVAQWDAIVNAGSTVRTSVPVVLETFTFLDRRGSRELALRWRDSLRSIPRFDILPCTAADLEGAWAFFDRRDLHKLSLVDASSFVLMRRHKIRIAFAFDVHFGAAGFRCLA